MTSDKCIEYLNDIKGIITIRAYSQYVEALDMAIKALEQQKRECKTCIHSDNGNCAYTEECHECMWESKYEQQPCEDCISREDAIKEFQVYREYDSNRTNDDWVDRIELVLTDLPSVQPIRPKGKWMATEDEEMNIVGYYCSSCDLPMETEEKTPFCPICGARMESDKE